MIGENCATLSLFKRSSSDPLAVEELVRAQGDGSLARRGWKLATLPVNKRTDYGVEHSLRALAIRL